MITVLPIDSGVLAMVWTATYYRDRLLGGNTEVVIKISQIFISTGNNTWFSPSFFAASSSSN